MLWTLLSTLVTLVTLYCLTSTDWLVGFERHYEGYKVNVANRTIVENQGYNFMEMREVRIPSYSPTIGKNKHTTNKLSRVSSIKSE